MDIYRNKDWTKPVFVPNESGGKKADVIFDETLYVRAYIDGGIHLVASIDINFNLLI